MILGFTEVVIKFVGLLPNTEMDFLTTVLQLIRRVSCLSTKYGYFLLKFTFGRLYTNEVHPSIMKTWVLAKVLVLFQNQSPPSG